MDLEQSSGPDLIPNGFPQIIKKLGETYVNEIENSLYAMSHAECARET